MLSLNGWDVLWTLVNLLILYLLMRRFLFRPVTAMLDSRSQRIAESLEQADEQKNEAEQLRTGYEAQIEKAREHAASILQDAQKRGDYEYNSRMEKARAEAARLQADTRAQLELERAAMLKDARREIAALALLAAAKVSERGCGSGDDSAFVEAFLSETGGAQ